MKECCRKTRNEIFKDLDVVINLRMDVLRNKISDLDLIPDDDKTEDQKINFCAFSCFHEELKNMKALFAIKEKKK